MTPKISKSWKLEILLAHDQSEPVEALILMNFARWREFHCHAAFHVVFHVTRRVVTPKSNTGRGQFARTNCSGSMMRFGSSLAFCSFENAWNENPSGSINRHGSWLGPLWIWAPAVAKQESYWLPRNLFHDTEISKTRNFRKYWRIWAVWCSNVMNFARWRDFNALRRSLVWLLHDS